MRELSAVASVQAAENNSTMVRRSSALLHAEEGHANQGKIPCCLFVVYSDADDGVGGFNLVKTKLL